MKTSSTELKTRARMAANVFKEFGIQQEDVANEVGISQAQVSRVLSGRLVRATIAFEEVCGYADRLKLGRVTPDCVRANDELINAVAEAWDGSVGHARSLALVIRSLAVLKGEGR